MGCSEAEWSIAFVGDAEILELNSSYRNKQTATDVLSFTQDTVSDDIHLLGDVVISVETAARQAEELGHTFVFEITRLLTHGVLHLCGYEHEDVDDSVAEEMFEKERELMQSIRNISLAE